MIKDDRKYSKTHEWAMRSGDSAVVGISDHAQDALGDITFVELPKVGATLKQGKECGVIESVKAASDLYSPVSGKVTEINGSLETAPEAINSDPYGSGWLFKITSLDDAEFAALMDAAAYGTFMESEA
ncbi:MAG: glycine cleavage system protein GcvH [Chitinispirillaceae bacterium]|nr:glycine cleavage system protein GcvH [Chitinispirillaceae bacterium]